MNRKVAPYGSWISPVTAQTFTARSVFLSQLRVDGSDIYWVEGNPQRGGRNVLLRRSALGHTSEVLPLMEGTRLIHVATRVHEYGGRAYAVKNGRLVISDGLDDRAYSFDIDDPRAALVPLTPLADCRYGDFEIDEVRGIVYAVREDHRGDGIPINSLVSIPLDGTGSRDESLIKTIFEGTDFVTAPTLSPDGTKLAWLTWNHPEMPWTKSELRVAALDFDGQIDSVATLVDKEEVCVYEPRWTLDGDLVHVDDSTGWANLYRTEGFAWREGEPADAWATRLRTRALHPSSQAFSQPHWQLGLHSFDNLDHDHLICSWSEGSRWHIGTIRLDNGLLEEWDTGWWPAGNVAAEDGRVVYLADSPTASPAIVSIDGSEVKRVRPSTEAEIPEEYISAPEFVSWPTRDGQEAYGFYYAPKNPRYKAPADSLPPLIVTIHGGPTGAARPGLSVACQYWTTRGFAVLDVNYRGSTGFGRQFRSALNGNFGIYDVTDSADGVVWLGERNLIDTSRVAIRGASSGGFTVLSALETSEVFAAGTSINGMLDLVELATNSHKFLTSYASILLNSQDLSEPIWKERSPIEHLDQVKAPLLLLQGADDPVIDASQAERVYRQLKDNGQQVAMILFDKEGHTFRRADSIERAWTAELSFYGEVWNIAVDQAIPIEIANQ